MRLVFTRDPEEFATLAEGFLAERVERNVLATVLLNTRHASFSGEEPLFACSLDEQGQVRTAASRTPPWPLLVSEFDAVSAQELIERWISLDASLPGVSGQPAAARAIAAAWQHQTGGRTTCRMREAMHVLTDVNDPPRPGHGRLRLATSAERELLIGWEHAFATEAGMAVTSEAEPTVARRLAHHGQFIWEDSGPVATLGVSPMVAGTVRIGPVYTPPQHRSRGYASSAVAAVSRRALAAGARQCLLFTDLQNPTSNKIYASVGFRRFADWEEHTFQQT